jgi:hypothetical protein
VIVRGYLTFCRWVRDNELKKAREQYGGAKAAIMQANRRVAWLDWLKSKAKSGDQEALHVLELRSRWKKTNDSLSGELKSEAKPQPMPEVVTNKGGKIYRDGLKIKNGELSISGFVSEEKYLRLLLAAKEEFGETFNLNGSDKFKHKMVAVAVKNAIEVKFADPVWEAIRQQKMINNKIKIEIINQDKEKQISIKTNINKLTIANKYIDERNLKRQTVSTIMEHKLFTPEDAGEMQYSGVRKMDGQNMVLLKKDTSVFVMPVSENAAQFIARRFKINDTVVANEQGFLSMPPKILHRGSGVSL